jgi:hypothetical protein
MPIGSSFVSLAESGATTGVGGKGNLRLRTADRPAGAVGVAGRGGLSWIEGAL